jgi:hypothetical protein
MAATNQQMISPPMRVDDLLGDPGIADFLSTHQGAANEIRGAADYLVMQKASDPVRALKKLLPSLSSNSVSIFFSYKKKDESAAKEVVGILRKLSAEKLKITYQAEFTNDIAGKKWRDQIQKAVKEANWFILLLPDPSDDWDWCLYETGLFEAQFTMGDRLICLHHPDTEVPNPIEGYHAVAATVPEVEKFLRMIMIAEHPIPGLSAINRAIEPDITLYAQSIVKAIRAPQKITIHEIFEPWVEIKIDSPMNLDDWESIDQARVLSANRAALELFGFFQKPEIWKDLINEVVKIDSNDNRWRKELSHVIGRIGTGRMFDPVQAVFKIANGKIYRPVVCAIDRDGKHGPINAYHITFTEEVGTIDPVNIPHRLMSLVTLVRFTFRFRWEVLEKYKSGEMTEDDVERMDNAMRRIKADAESRGISREDDVISLFTADKAKYIKEMYTEWYKYKNDDGSGELDLAIANKDTQAIQRILNNLLTMNQEFLEMASDRFSEMVSSNIY